MPVSSSRKGIETIREQRLKTFSEKKGSPVHDSVWFPNDRSMLTAIYRVLKRAEKVRVRMIKVKDFFHDQPRC